MRDRQENSSPPANQAYGFVEAFLDGERVDPTSLKEALADAQARDHFIDLLLLRDAMGDVAPLAPNAATFRPDRRSRAKWLTAAAATVLVSLSVGYAAGQRVVASDGTPPNVEVFLPMDRPTSAPAPTRSIAFEPGVNWTDSPGGQ
jgi:hypothetical protein